MFNSEKTMDPFTQNENENIFKSLTANENDTKYSHLSDISSFYKGAKVFLTGGTGENFQIIFYMMSV